MLSPLNYIQRFSKKYPGGTLILIFTCGDAVERKRIRSMRTDSVTGTAAGAFGTPA